MRVDQDVVAGNACVVCRDESDSPHVRREVIDLGDSSTNRQEAVRKFSKVQDLELVSVARTIFGVFQIHSPDPVALCVEPLDEMMADETSGARHQYSDLF